MLKCPINLHIRKYFFILASILLVMGPLCTHSLGVTDPFVYDMNIEGVSDKNLLSEMKALSDTWNLKSRPPASLRLLRRRLDRDVDRFIKLLKSRGYYGAKVGGQIDTQAKPVKIMFRVDKGAPFLLKSVQIETVQKKEILPLKEPPAAVDIGLQLGKPLVSISVVNAEKALLLIFQRRGFPFPSILARKVIIDHKTYSAIVMFRVDPGPLAKFGPTTIIGLKSVDESLVRSKIRWKEGDIFNSALVQKCQKNLSEMGLFTTVRISPAPHVEQSGLLPVTISVRERKHRSLGAGISYRTDEGPGANASWEHRNFFGRGERLGFTARGSDFTLSGEINFRKPFFYHEDQSLIFSSRFAEDKPDAFKSQNITSSLSIERIMKETLALSVGIGFKASRVEQFTARETFSFSFIPASLRHDTSDNLLDPTRGGRLSLHVAPYYNLKTMDFGFTKTYMSYKRYLKVSSNPTLVIALRTALGVILGAELEAIPADERYYAGGGGSIRGYPYQTVGPLVNGSPVGGRSFFEISLEPRVKITQRLGFVIFLDGGSAFIDTWPDSAEKLRWGAGMGIRYTTPVGPIRFDVGIPIDRREEIDDSFQIYVSLGQAF